MPMAESRRRRPSYFARRQILWVARCHQFSRMGRVARLSPQESSGRAHRRPGLRLGGSSQPGSGPAGYVPVLTSDAAELFPGCHRHRSQVRAFDGFVSLFVPAAAALRADQLRVEGMAHRGLDSGGRLEESQRVERGSNACSNFDVGKSHVSLSVLSTVRLTVRFPVRRKISLTSLRRPSGHGGVFIQ